MLKLKKFFLLFFLILSVSACGVKSKNNVALINGHKIKLRVADDNKERWQGLSGVASLSKDEGMLFVFPDYRKRVFVMRNMLIPLDIIFIKDNKIIDIYKNLPPEGENYKERYSSSLPVNYVLEINAGESDYFKIKVGDEIKFNLFK